MTAAEMETGESGWTKANLQKLLASMKSNIPGNDSTRTYYQGMKSLDWGKVAFPPFSPAACEEKWKNMLRKMRKVRTLTDLIIEAEDVVSNPTLNQKIHPEFPKAPKPANAIFYEEKAAKFRKNHPKLDNRKLLKLVMKKYEALPGEKKSKYEEKYQLAKEEYDILMEKFRETYHEAPVGKRKTNLKRKKVSEDPLNGEQCSEDTEGNDTKKSRGDDLPPKPPRDSYNLFCKEQLSNMEGVPRQSFVSVWAQRWRKLTDTQKQEYKIRCQELQREYSVKLKQYLSTFRKDEQQQILDENDIKPKLYTGITRTKQKANSTKEFHGEPKIPCRSGNVIFCKQQMERLKEQFPKSRQRFAKVQQMWKELSEMKKQRYRNKVNNKLMEYTKQLQTWFKTLTAAEQEAYWISNPSKRQYLEASQTQTKDISSVPTEVVYIPSDSEDEDIEDSSSDEEEGDEEEEEEEEEEQNNDIIMFKVY